MAKVEVVESLYKEIDKKFKKDAITVYELIESLEDHPKKGRILAHIAGLLIKEIRYKSFRFYFLVDGQKMKAIDEEELIEVLLRFVRMSNKKHQQKTIEEIKHVLREIGPSGFE